MKRSAPYAIFCMLIFACLSNLAINTWAGDQTTPSMEGEELLIRAQMLYEKGDIQQAEKTLFDAIRMENIASPWINLAQFYDDTNQYSKAIKVTNKILNSFPGNIEQIAEIHNRAIDELGEELPSGIPHIVIHQQIQTTVDSTVAIPIKTLRNRKPTDKILARCQEKWKTDNAMIQYCMKNQIKSKRFVESTYSDEVKTFCNEKWGWDYQMIEYCIHNQRKARTNLQNLPNDDSYMFCKDKWNQDYRMIEYCLKN